MRLRALSFVSLVVAFSSGCGDGGGPTSESTQAERSSISVTVTLCPPPTRTSSVSGLLPLLVDKAPYW